MAAVAERTPNRGPWPPTHRGPHEGSPSTIRLPLRISPPRRRSIKIGFIRAIPWSPWLELPIQLLQLLPDAFQVGIIDAGEDTLEYGVVCPGIYRRLPFSMRGIPAARRRLTVGVAVVHGAPPLRPGFAPLWLGKVPCDCSPRRADAAAGLWRQGQWVARDGPERAGTRTGRRVVPLKGDRILRRQCGAPCSLSPNPPKGRG